MPGWTSRLFNIAILRSTSFSMMFCLWQWRKYQMEDYLVCCCLVQRNNLLFRNDEIDIEQVWKMVRVRSWAWLHSKTRIFHFSMFDWWRQPSLGLKGTYGSFL
ncbi:hypothetical protein AAZX31_20G155700 [Glycine max]|uniref:Uncharacterized protein n=1 Tax=Glycine max TaxID=3847 RepID=A0A0R0EP99_SOYBN|nr:hypothetical protein JHK86_056480 [Glycine max]KAG4910625.1 hypothetical protein JHK87_056741 [Glycine soja]KAG4919206.1 hypothetical protein JHK85_057487 [Glycine max]KAG5075285.1 hypothetical protein JHK84_056516 [Glycine max]KAG5077951.1 hypothetical protein JHK82_056646 [Glycine max]